MYFKFQSVLSQSLSWFNRSSHRRKLSSSRNRWCEVLEDRTLLAAVSDAGTDVLTIDLDNANEQLQIISQGDHYIFTSTNSFAAASGTDPANPGSAFVGLGTNEVILTPTGLGQYTEIRIIDSATGTSVVFNDSGAHAYSDAFTVELDNMAAIPALSFNGMTSFGDQALSAVVDTNIKLNPDSQLSTNDGGITFRANVLNNSTQAHAGIELESARVFTTGSGDIELVGTGGQDAGTDRLYGVSLGQGSLVESTSTAADAGQIIVTGVGGDGKERNYGVVLGNASVVQSSMGNILLDGEGGTGTDACNYGVRSSGGSTIHSTGIGANAAMISLTGQAGFSSGSATGVDIESSFLETRDGDISIMGTSLSGLAGANNNGVEIESTRIESTGVGILAGTISITGTGGNGGTNVNEGVDLGNTDLITIDGDILIDGTGGVGSGTGQRGVQIRSSSMISSAGTTLDAGQININGIGGQGTSSSFGIGIRDDGTIVASNRGSISLTGQGGTGTSNALGVAIHNDALVTSVFGDIQVTGTGGTGTSSQQRGIRMSGYAAIRSTGTGQEAATITLDGTGGEGSEHSSGISMEQVSIETIDGDVTFTGVAGEATGADSDGIASLESRISSTGTGGEAGKITFTGSGGLTGTNNQHGIDLASTVIESVDGDISLTGTGGTGSANDQRGVYVRSGSMILSSGTGTEAATITVNGTGGHSLQYAIGVSILNSGTSIISYMGEISITGSGGEGDPDLGREHHGVSIVYARILSFAKGNQAGDVTITGTAGIANEGSSGVRIRETITAVKSVDADISITGVGYGRQSRGVTVWRQAQVVSTGSGSIMLDGTGGNDSTFNSVGVLIGVQGSLVSVNTGSISITGVGGTNDTNDSDDNYGVQLQNSGRIQSTGRGANVGTISITGTGGDGRSDNYGVRLNSNSNISTVDADVILNGTATGNHACLYGIAMGTGADIQSAGVGPNAGTITLIGQGGQGLEGNHGIRISEDGTKISSIDGDISISGTGGPNGHGVRIRRNEILIESTGTGEHAAQINIQGTSGTGDDRYPGVRIESIAEIRTVDGDINISAMTQNVLSEIGLDIWEATIESKGDC